METSRRYVWQWYYELATLEVERAKLPVLITAAQAAIDARIAEIRAMNDGTPAERQAITDARNGLQILLAEVRIQRRPWREIAREITNEQDQRKALALMQELSEAYEEQQHHARPSSETMNEPKEKTA